MSRNMNRREALGTMALAALAAACEGAPAVMARAESAMGAGFEPAFFTPHEWETVRMLVDYIIPRDDRSGSATDAGVPEFMDFMMIEYPDSQLAMRGGLGWIDAESRDRFGAAFVNAAEAERTALLDEIAWPDRAAPEMSQGVAFFNRFRDLTSSGFWSSKIGVEDLQYMGNTVVTKWEGCPPEALEKLGVSYDGWNA